MHFALIYHFVEPVGRFRCELLMKKEVHVLCGSLTASTSGWDCPSLNISLFTSFITAQLTLLRLSHYVQVSRVASAPEAPLQSRNGATADENKKNGDAHAAGEQFRTWKRARHMIYRMMVILELSSELYEQHSMAQHSSPSLHGNSKYSNFCTWLLSSRFSTSTEYVLLYLQP